MDETQLAAARRILSERTAGGKRLSAADLVRMVEEKFDQSGLASLLEKMPEDTNMTDKQTIERAIIGKRIVAVEWFQGFRGAVFSLDGKGECLLSPMMLPLISRSKRQLGDVMTILALFVGWLVRISIT